LNESVGSVRKVRRVLRAGGQLGADAGVMPDRLDQPAWARVWPGRPKTRLPARRVDPAVCPCLGHVCDFTEVSRNRTRMGKSPRVARFWPLSGR
jgi:hypothetical protein